MERHNSLFHLGFGITFAAAMLLGGVANTDAAWMTVETFDGLDLGAIHEQNGWFSDDLNVVGGGPGTPFSGSNRGLANGVGGTEAYKSFGTIADGSTGTVFFQLYLTELTVSTSFGLADTDVGGGSPFRNYRSQLHISDSGHLSVGGALDQTSPLEIETWYNIWIVSDNQNNESQFYIQGGSFTSQTQLTANSGEITSFAYRLENGESHSAPLTNFLIASGGVATANSAYVDNIHFSSGVLLTTPIPEPASYALLGLGLFLLVLLRRQGSHRTELH